MHERISIYLNKLYVLNEFTNFVTAEIFLTFLHPQGMYVLSNYNVCYNPCFNEDIQTT